MLSYSYAIAAITFVPSPAVDTVITADVAVEGPRRVPDPGASTIQGKEDNDDNDNDNGNDNANDSGSILLQQQRLSRIAPAGEVGVPH
jgi:hypothetical protein